MPIYEYECLKCGHRFEIQQKVTDPPRKRCTYRNGGKKVCGGKLRKVFYPAAVIFKGSGWHVTDYGKYGANGGNNGNGKKKGADDKGSSSTTDSTSTSDAKKETTAAKT